MMKRFAFFTVFFIGIFVIPNTSFAKINSYEIKIDRFGDRTGITLSVDGFLPVGTVCNILPAPPGSYYGSWNQPSDLYNVVIKDVHVMGGANIGGTQKNYNSQVVTSCSDSKIDITSFYFGNLKIWNSATYNDPLVIKVGDSTMNVVDETTIYFKDVWDCGNWTSCSSGGSQTRTCNLVTDSPSENIPSPATSQSCAPPCTATSWSCADWNQCSADGSQTRVCNKTNCQGGIASPETAQSCVFIPPTCTSWTYSNWSSCSANGGQTRSVISSSPSSCTGGSPVINQSCTYTPPVPSCSATNWSCGSWGACSQNGSQLRTCDKNVNCQGGVSSPAISQSCAYVAPVPSCTSFNYSSWSECSPDGKQTRNITSKYPYNCEGGESPKITQSCTYTPSCTADTWTCGAWGSCSLSGIQNRSCTKTFDCPNVQTAPPTTDQYCEAPNKPVQQVPQDSGEIANQDIIIKATVKLVCLYENGAGVQGSGTVIDPDGTILTNKHVVDKTLGCLVKFINNFNDTPNYDIRQIADIQKISSSEDVAILKLRNPQNKKLTYIDITKANSNFRLGTKVHVYGYPAIFGANMTYTSGDFGGIDGSYLKTGVILEHGNSGGGAYLSNGTFIGIPTAVRKGELNALGYILSINTINAWLGNSSFTYNNNSNNNYSRVSSILETIDLKTLGSLRQVIPGTKDGKEIINEVTQSSPTAPPSIIKEIGQNNKSQKVNPSQDNSVSSEKELVEENENDSSIKISEQRRSTVANAVQEMVKVAERNGVVGQEIKTIAQTQTQNQEKLEAGIQNIQSRSGFARFFVGPNYGEIKESQKLLEQNKEQIQKLNQLRAQIIGQKDQQQIAEQIQLLGQTTQQIENTLDEAQKGFSLFGWMFRLFAK